MHESVSQSIGLVKRSNICAGIQQHRMHLLTTEAMLLCATLFCRASLSISALKNFTCSGILGSILNLLQLKVTCKRERIEAVKHQGLTSGYRDAS